MKRVLITGVAGMIGSHLLDHLIVKNYEIIGMDNLSFGKIENIQEHLGVDIKLANQEWKVYLQTLTEDSPQVWHLGWCADYTDQNNWVHEVFNQREGAIRSKWSVDDHASI